MIDEELLAILKGHPEFFVQNNGEAEWSDGWKVSIQGRTLEDLIFVFDRIIGLLMETKASFKLGTQKLIDLGRENEQSTKLLTIYIPNGVTPESYCELVRLHISDYEGAADIGEKKSYTKYAEGIYYRNDRTSEGVYIPA